MPSEEEQIVNNLTGKADCVYQKMTRLDNSYVLKLLENFDPIDSNFHIIFESTNLPLNINGLTRPPSISGINNTFIVQINSGNIENRPVLSVVRTILHEAIHARLIEFALRNGGTNLENNFPGVYDFALRHKYNWDHEQMASFYIQTIAEGLKQFDNAKNSNQFYEALAWQGLSNIMNQNTDDPNDMINTQAWQNKSDLEKMWIENTIRNYSDTGDKNCQL